MKGIAMRKSNRDSEALKCYTEAQVILSKMEHARNDAEYLFEVIRLKEAMANVVSAEQRLQCFQYSVETYKKVIDEYSGLSLHHEYAKALHSYADAFVRVGNVSQAIEQMKQSICIWQLAINENGMTQHAGKLYYSKLYLAMLYLSVNDQSSAVNEFDDVRKESGMTMNEMMEHYEQYVATGGQDVFS
jgi:tetratricopeptide (TPR) repeat protein